TQEFQAFVVLFAGFPVLVQVRAVGEGGNQQLDVVESYTQLLLGKVLVGFRIILHRGFSSCRPGLIYRYLHKQSYQSLRWPAANGCRAAIRLGGGGRSGPGPAPYKYAWSLAPACGCGGSGSSPCPASRRLSFPLGRFLR